MVEEVIVAETTTPREMLRHLGVRTVDWLSRMDLARAGPVPFMPRSQAHDQSFFLVVGDSALEAIFRWNRIFAAPAHDNDRALWIPAALATDPEFILALVDWLRLDFYNNERQSLRIVSCTADETVLRTLAETIAQPLFARRSVERFGAESLPVPRLDVHQYPIVTEKFADLTIVQEATLSDGKALLRHANPPHRQDRRGGYMVDCEVQFRPEQFNHTNLRPRWELPRRLGLGRLFFRAGQAVSRITVHGNPSMEIRAEAGPIELSLPTDHSLVNTLVAPHDTNCHPRRALPPARFTHAEISTVGGYLRGVIQLFGDIHQCIWMFRDIYTRSVLLELAGKTPMSRKAAQERIAQVLAERMPEGQTVVTGSHQEVARRIEERLHDPAPPEKLLTLKELKRLFSIAEGKLDRRPHAAPFSLIGEMETTALLQAGVIQQGCEIRCRRCGTRNWYRQDELRATMACPGCLQEVSMTLAPTWSYRLNSLVRNGITRHGLLPVIDAIRALDGIGFKVLWFAACQDLFEGDSENAFTDLDLFYVQGRKWGIGEVKTSMKGYDAEVFTKLRETSLALQPDQVVVAAPGDAWPADIAAKIEALKADLARHHVEVRPLLLRGDDFG
jgi:hypothetical protein